MRPTLFSTGLFCLLLTIGFTPIISLGQSNGNVVLGTTTSVRDAGLLDVLLRPFTETTGDVVKVIAVGSGHAMELGRRGEADILILHDPAGEEQFVRDGYGIDRVPLMHNEFVLVGPGTDPADISGLAILEAFSKIAASRTRFLSRGDNSGTHAREQALWGRSNQNRDREWYWETGQGMSSTLQIAFEVRAYTLSDIGTYLRHPASQDLEIMVSNDSLLYNPYHVMLVNPARFDGLNVEAARRLWDYLGSPSSRALIAEFGVVEFGRPLFYPDSAEVH